MLYIKQHFFGLALLIGLLSVLSSCDKGFQDMNVNPNAYTTPVIGNLFTNALVKIAGTGTPDRNRTNIKYFAGTMQYMASLGTNWSGDKNYENGQFGDFFETAYSQQLKPLQQAIASLKGNADLINEFAIANILRVLLMTRLTDCYGDIPYSEAGVGFLEADYKPRYDKQSDIYADMLKTLETSAGQLDPAKTTYGVSDPMFQGKTDKWKTFAFSLMLRLGMRLTKVDAASAKTWVQKAIAGGVMTSNADIAFLAHTPANSNTWNYDAEELKRESFPESSQGKGPVKLGKTMIDLLQAYSDPRLPFYATLWQGNINSQQAAMLPTTTNPALQKGLPNGYDATTIKTAIPGFTNDQLVNYSEPNTGTIANYSSPTVLQSYAEVEFLLAEAALRGWGTGTASAHYNAAITASMKSTTIFPGGIVIGQPAIDSYLSAQALNTGGSIDDQMKQIHTQYYLAHFMWYDNFEAFANQRRTGYPVLPPPNYAGNFTGGQALKRLRYPISETVLNTANYNAAVASQGPDLYTTHVWWDK
jgi:hypothetical protein